MKHLILINRHYPLIRTNADAHNNIGIIYQEMGQIRMRRLNVMKKQ